MKSAPLKLRPSWVPEWAWEHCRDFIGRAWEGEQVLDSGDCACVWRALERRKRTDRGSVLGLLHAVRQALKFDDVAKMTPGKRAKAVDNLVVKIKNIRSEIDRLRIQNFSYSRESVIAAIAYEAANANSLGGDFESCCKEPGSRNAHLIYDALRQSALDAMNEMNKHFDETLQGLEQSLLDWKSQPVLVDRPEKTNAARTYFIRYINNWFVDNTGTPLRLQTQRLTELFFNCDGMKAGDFANLAPARRKPEAIAKFRGK